MSEKCVEVEELEDYLKEHGMKIYSEHGEGGWVNVHCEFCNEVHEVYLEGYGD